MEKRERIKNKIIGIITDRQGVKETELVAAMAEELLEGDFTDIIYEMVISGKIRQIKYGSSSYVNPGRSFFLPKDSNISIV